ncbi:hypothetical protein KKA53_05260 [Candidatus Dependentiae bacterium]|nr:hypothetical protein [Candidatus Dependentiae bacterium]
MVAKDKTRKVFDLDRIAPEEVYIRLGGVEYAVREPSLERIPELQRITAEYKLDKVDEENTVLGEKQITGMCKMIGVLIPDEIPDEVLRGMTTRQMAGLQLVIGQYIRPDDSDIMQAISPSKVGEEASP